MKSILYSKEVNRNFVFFGAIGLLPLLMTQLTALLLPGLPKMMQPGILIQLVWFGIGLGLAFLRQRTTQLAGILLIAISAFGQAHAMAAFVYYGEYFRTDLLAANNVFLFMCACHLSGMLLHERLSGVDGERTPLIVTTWERPGSLFLLITFAFPFVWALDFVLNVGYIPMLKGGAIVDEMYSLNFGRLYGYGIVIAVSGILLRERLRISSKFTPSLLMVLGLIAYCAIAVMDGKRVFLIVFILTLIIAELRFKNWSEIRIRFGGLALLLIVLYVGIEFLRQGSSMKNRDAILFALMGIGVEYRDFSFVIQNLGNNALVHFDLLKNAIGGFGNWFILALFDISKGQYVGSGSAYQIAIALRSNFGIRIGLLAELYVGYAWLGGVFALILGYVYSSVASAMTRARTEVGAGFFCVILAVFLLGYVGQASVTTGYYSVLLYLWLLWRLLTYLGNRYDRSFRSISISQGKGPVVR